MPLSPEISAGPRPYAAFRLAAPLTHAQVDVDAPRQARDVAAWVRHAVGEACAGWPFAVDPVALVHGHAPGGAPQQRLSYVPLPTITPATTGTIARVLVVGSPGLDLEVAWLRTRLAGRPLTWRGEVRAVLVPLPDDDWVLRRYVGCGDTWSTCTPIVLPGYDDRSSTKGTRLVRRAMRQAGFAREVVDAARELAWGPEAFRPGVAPAARFTLPDKLRGIACHVRVWFGSAIDGPIVVGSGRHRGLGVFALA
jgi:CRISPR-associated protein Csb2